MNQHAPQETNLYPGSEARFSFRGLLYGMECTVKVREDAPQGRWAMHWFNMEGQVVRTVYLYRTTPRPPASSGCSAPG